MQSNVEYRTRFSRHGITDDCTTFAQYCAPHPHCRAGALYHGNCARHRHRWGACCACHNWNALERRVMQEWYSKISGPDCSATPVRIVRLGTGPLQHPIKDHEEIHHLCADHYVLGRVCCYKGCSGRCLLGLKANGVMGEAESYAPETQVSLDPLNDFLKTLRIRPNCSASVAKLFQKRDSVHYVCMFHHHHQAHECCTCIGECRGLPPEPSPAPGIPHQRLPEPPDLGFEEGMNVERQGQGTSTQASSGNLTATGHSQITFNVYGSNYANPTSTSSQAQGFGGDKMIGAAVDALKVFKPVLKAPDVEENGYSDRLFQVIAGNTGVTTQEAAAGAMVAYGEYPKYFDHPGFTNDPGTRPGPSCDRFYEIGTGTWNVADVTGDIIVSLPLPYALQDLGVFGQNLTFHAMYNCGWCLHVQCNASRFHQGCLGVFFVPGGPTESASLIPSGYTVHQLPVFPHQYINLRTNNAATIFMPYIAANPLSYPVVEELYRVVVVVIVPLQYGSGASTALPITISAAPMCSSFYGLRNQVKAQGLTLPVYQVPGSCQFLTTLNTSGIPVFPTHTPTPEFHIPGEVLDLVDVCKIATFIEPVKVTVAASSAPFSLIWSCDMDLDSSVLTTTYVSRCAAQFLCYKGALCFDFMFCGSAMHTCKIAICYTPPGGELPSTYQQAILGTYVIWDVGLQSTCEFMIPFISASDRRYGPYSGNTFGANGFITVWLQTQLIHPPNSVNQASITVCLRAAGPFGLYTLMDPAVIQGDGEVSVGDAPALGAQETGTHAVKDPTTTMEAEHLSVLPERDSSVKNFLSRFCYVGSAALQNSFASFELNFSSSSINRYLIDKLRMFTYFRADLDVVLVTSLINTTSSFTTQLFQCQYSPPGSSKPAAADDPVWNTTNNPTVFWKLSDPNPSFRIPYFAATSALNMFYDGFSNFPGHGGTEYQYPSATFGTLSFSARNPTTGACKVLIYVRFVNARCWVPRPIFDFGNALRCLPICLRDKSTIVQVPTAPPLEEADYDVPQAPRCEYTSPHSKKIAERLQRVFYPRVQQQGFSDAEFQGLLDSFLQSSGQTLGSSFATGVFDAVSKTSAIGTSWVKAAIQWLIKLICSVVILIRSHADPVILGAVSMALGVDILCSDPFAYLRKTFVINLNLVDDDKEEEEDDVVEKQGPIEKIKDLNTAIQLGKGLEWFIQMLQKFVNWVQKIFCKFEHRSQACESLQHFLVVCKQWDAYETNPKEYDSDSVRTVAQWILNFKQKVDLETLSPMMLQQLNKYHSKALRFVGMSRDRGCEPIGLLLHGQPGTGKSLITCLLGRAISKHYKVADPYFLPPDPKYFDGYQQQKVVVMDDLGQNPDGLDCAWLCQMISTADFHPPMASVEEKGIRFVSDFVLASTNLRNLAPPTIAVPAALDRRFAFNLDLHVDAKFQTLDGKLDVVKAMVKCNHNNPHFTKCTPLLCGGAVKLVCRRTGQSMSVTTVMDALLQAYKDRTDVSCSINDLFVETQGPQPIRPVVRKKKTQMSAEIADLIQSCPKEEVLQWCVEQGYAFSPPVQQVLLEREAVTKWNAFKVVAASLTAFIAILTSLVFLCRLIPVGGQGPYDGPYKRPLQKPGLKIQVQGATNPDLEYAASLLKNNLVPFVSDAGKYTALGLFDRFVVVPKHALGENMTLGGKPLNVETIRILENNNTNLELALIQYSGGNQFRDITAHLPDSLTSYKDCYLVLNSPVFEHLVLPVGRVTPFGVINLDGEATKNTLAYTYPTIKGHCGGVIVKAGKIVGMHIGGNGVYGFAAALKRSYFQIACQGLLKEAPPPPKSVHVVTTSKLQPSVYQEFWEPKTAPAVLSKYDSRCECDLDTAMFSKYKGDVKEAPFPEMRIATEQYLEQIRPILPPDVTRELSLEEAVFGYQDLSPLDLDTSAGWPYVIRGETKRDLIRGTKEEPDLSRLVNALDLHGYNHPFVTYLKDETRPLEKIKEGKTRLIECSSLNDTIRFRRTFGVFMAAFIANPGIVTGTAVGCDPDVHWSQFYATLHLENCIAFDYKNFDASVPTCMFNELKYFFTKLGFSAQAVQLLDHISCSHHVYRSQAYIVEGGMPSGTPGTSLLNSMINNLVVKTCCLVAYSHIDLFQLHIIAYGDDLIVSYPYELDPRAFVSVAAKLGMTMTPPDKQDEFPSPGIENCTFLKRKFRPDPAYPFLIHPEYPLELCFESLCWTRKAGTLVEHVTSLAYLAWHGGPQKYQEFCDFVRKPSFGQSIPIPPYGYLEHRWLSLFT